MKGGAPKWGAPEHVYVYRMQWKSICLALGHSCVWCSLPPLCSQREANSRPRQWNSHNQPSSVAALPGNHRPCSSLIQFPVFVCFFISLHESQHGFMHVIHSYEHDHLSNYLPNSYQVCFSSHLCMLHPLSLLSFFLSMPWTCVRVLAVQLGKMRLMIPCRALTCSHLQCFDATLYIQMNEKKPTWVCPVCDKKAPYEHLIIDG